MNQRVKSEAQRGYVLSILRDFGHHPTFSLNPINTVRLWRSNHEKLKSDFNFTGIFSHFAPYDIHASSPNIIKY